MHNKILIVGAIIILLIIVIGKMKTTASPISADDWQIPLAGIMNDYGKPIAQSVEQIYRLETANFTSKGFLQTYAPGMTAFSNSFPYGWDSLADFWNSYNGQYKPSGTVVMPENETGKNVTFIKFQNIEGGMYTLAYWLYLGNRPGHWFSTLEDQMISYEAKLNNITPSFINSLT